MNEKENPNKSFVSILLEFIFVQNKYSFFPKSFRFKSDYRVIICSMQTTGNYKSFKEMLFYLQYYINMPIGYETSFLPHIIFLLNFTAIYAQHTKFEKYNPV